MLASHDEHDRSISELQLDGVDQGLSRSLICFVTCVKNCAFGREVLLKLKTWHDRNSASRPARFASSNTR